MMYILRGRGILLSTITNRNPTPDFTLHFKFEHYTFLLNNISDLYFFAAS